MRQEELKKLLGELSIDEKINQLVQLMGAFYEKEGVVTGPMADMGFGEENLQMAGSILGTVGADKLIKIQKEYMEKHPHKIPMLFMADVINGYRTIFPIPLAQGCTFEPEVAKEGASIAAKESAVTGLHVTFSPMVDLVRDARWGRVMESTGEDVYLNSCFAKAIVEGYQGDDIGQKGKVAACVKHFAAYGAPAGGRDYNNVELSPRTLKEDYLPAYKAALDAGCELVMTSFNTLDRIPASGNKKLMRDILRKEMGFDGVLISDWAAIEELTAHGVAADQKEAARLALEAGVDIDMVTTCYCGYLKELVEEGRVSEELLDESVLRVLELKNKLGLFENPIKDADPEAEKEVILCREHRESARKAAVKSFVLLKNDGMLPLDKEEKTAFIGPYVDNKWLYGAWSIFGQEADTVTIKEGVESRADIQNVSFARGCDVLDEGQEIAGFTNKVTGCMSPEEKKEALLEAVSKAREADKVVLALGEHAFQSGEAASRAEILIPDEQQELLEEISKVNQNITVVLFQGRPLDLRKVEKYAKTILVAWFPGSEGGNAVADVLYGDEAPSGRLAMSFPYSVGQVPVHYDEFSTGRPLKTLADGNRFGSKYLDIPNEPLYPFGYGLTYTDFSYTDIRLSTDKMKAGETITAQVTVTNTGSRFGEDVVQMYIHDETASVIRPVRKLKGFRKIALNPGESTTVCFDITEAMLKFYDIDMNYVSEPGMFQVFIGSDSRADNELRFKLSH